MYVDYQVNVLTSEFCKELINTAEFFGFEEAAVNHYGKQEIHKNIRNNSRLILPDESYMASNLLDCVLVPSNYKGLKFSKIGEFFRVYKYEPGQYFKPHRDGSVCTDEGEESLLTLLIYLNTNPNSGTIVYPYGISQKWAKQEYECVEGCALIFDHNTWHEGKEVTEGVKYVLRTDIFYKD